MFAPNGQNQSKKWLLLPIILNRATTKSVSNLRFCRCGLEIKSISVFTVSFFKIVGAFLNKKDKNNFKMKIWRNAIFSILATK